jgi:small conductance mechanosensitive channel
MLAAAKADARVLASPAPWAKLTALAESSQTVRLRAWVKPDDWWDARFDLLKQVKAALTRANIHFPYPHQVSLTRGEVLPDEMRTGRAVAGATPSRPQ